MNSNSTGNLGEDDESEHQLHVPEEFRNRVDKRPYVEREYLERLRAQAPVVITADRAVYDELALVLYKSLERGKHRRRVHSYSESFWGKGRHRLSHRDTNHG